MGDEANLGFLGNMIFFLDVFVALLLITGSWLLIQSPFGKFALAFGYTMLIITTGLKLLRKW